MITWISSWLWCFDLMSRTYEKILVMFGSGLTACDPQEKPCGPQGSEAGPVRVSGPVRTHLRPTRDGLRTARQIRQKDLIRVFLIRFDKYKREGRVHVFRMIFQQPPFSFSLAHVLRQLSKELSFERRDWRNHCRRPSCLRLPWWPNLWWTRVRVRGSDD